MRAIRSRSQLEEFGRIRLSNNFFMRDFLYSEIAVTERLLNAPDNPKLATSAGERLCQELLEPLNAAFGRIAIRSAYRSCDVNERGSQLKPQKCSSNEKNYASHIWDRRDSEGRMGAAACIVIPWLVDHYERGGRWQDMAWWIHDHLSYSYLEFFPKRCAFNIQWREDPERSVYSHIAPDRGYLTRSGMANHVGDHSEYYRDFPA